jgi:hypothetical protein
LSCAAHEREAWLVDLHAACRVRFLMRASLGLENKRILRI